MGRWKNNKRHAQGIYTYANGDKYIGGYKDNRKHGHGTYYYVNGNKYVGKYKEDKRNGQGTYTFSNGEVKEGIWKDDKFQYKKKKSTPTSNSKIEEYKSFCSKLRFTPGTEKFAECVVDGMNKG